MSNQLQLSISTSRAKKARFREVLNGGFTRKFLSLVVFFLSASWLILFVFSSNVFVHALLVPASLFLILLIWYQGELQDLPPSSSLESPGDISDILEARTLAKIKHDNPSPQELAQAVAQLPGGLFFLVRYGISPELLINQSSTDPLASLIVWQTALHISKQMGKGLVDSSTLAAALILAIPGHDTTLATLNINNEDIIDGVLWYGHIDAVIKHQRERKNYGGIGRDLSFGWTPLLSQLGQNITETIERGGLLRRIIGTHKEAVDQLMHTLSQGARQNAVLVGEPGIGKTTIAHGFAQQLIEDNKTNPSEIQYSQVVKLDSASLIANAKGDGQLEELMIRLCNEAIAAKNIILFFDEAQLFLKEGTGSVDLSSMFLQLLEGGSLRIVLALSEQEWLRVSQVNPGLAQLMNRVSVSELTGKDVFTVMQDQTLLLEAEHNVVYMQQALKEAYRLSERFIHEQVFPGKAIKLLEAGAGFAEQGKIVSESSIQQAVEKTFDVKVQTANTVEDKNVLLNLESEIHKRMINQTRAVSVVSDALRRARAGVRNQNKPIGTFLFLGPTGVGKTELSKSLAAVYFGGEDRMVRIDLNEFSQPEDTSRLLAVGATDPYSLCAQIAKQPFSVVLLDEIEKAHPNVLNLLLQMLDEGTLRDAENKPISFKDAIIIATSNAGADKIRAHIERGEQLEQFEDSFINELINANIFRPEFLNRFDETVLFRPLRQEELLQVVDLLIASLNKTLDAKKLRVELTPSAKEMLAKTGYDPRLGARPLRRMVQRSVENVVAQKVLQGTAAPGDTLLLDEPELKQELSKT